MEQLSRKAVNSIQQLNTGALLAAHENIQTRIWWLEIVRGLLTLAFGLLYFSLQNLIYVLIYMLGVYLLLDGVLDLYRLFAGKRTAAPAFWLYLGSAVSIGVGLVSLLTPGLTLFYSGLFLALVVTWQGIQIFRGAGNERTWPRIYGVLLITCGLILSLPPLLSLTSRMIVLFVGVYACANGGYLLFLGLRLWLVPTSAIRQMIRRATRQELDIPPRALATSRRALVFVRHSGAGGLGHVSWAFEWKNGWFNVGGIENRHAHAVATAEKADFWTARTLDPIATMQKYGQGYDEYKIFVVEKPASRVAWNTVVWLSRVAYTVVHRNCADATYDVLRAYGVSNLPDPVMQYAPNDWYDALPGTSYSIVLNPTIPIHVRSRSRKNLNKREKYLRIPSYLVGTPPPWRERGIRGLSELLLVWEHMVSDVYTIFRLVLQCIRPSSPRQ